MEFDHDHGLSPSKTRFYKCNRVLKPHVRRQLELNAKASIKIGLRRQLELNAKASIKMNTNFNSLVVEAGGMKTCHF